MVPATRTGDAEGRLAQSIAEPWRERRAGASSQAVPHLQLALELFQQFWIHRGKRRQLPGELKLGDVQREEKLAFIERSSSFCRRRGKVDCIVVR